MVRYTPEDIYFLSIYFDNELGVSAWLTLLTKKEKRSRKKKKELIRIFFIPIMPMRTAFSNFYLLLNENYSL